LNEKPLELILRGFNQFQRLFALKLKLKFSISKGLLHFSGKAFILPALLKQIPTLKQAKTASKIHARKPFLLSKARTNYGGYSCAPSAI
jgi:hypothetical protein